MGLFQLQTAWLHFFVAGKTWAFYNNAEFFQWYLFTKEYVIHLNGKVGPAILSERNSAIPLLLQLLVALCFYAIGIFLEFTSPQSAELSAVYKRISTFILNQTAGLYGGAIDCIHIFITNPGCENGDYFHN